MAITTQDGIVAGGNVLLTLNKLGGPAVVSGGTSSFWAATGGVPAAGSLSIGNTTSGVIPTDATTGAPSFANPGGGAFSYLARISAASNTATTAILFDRAWHAGSFTPTSGSYAGFTGATVPDRPTDFGYELWAECATVLSAASHTLTITYVNQDGTGSRSATIVLPASLPVSRMVPATLQGTDTGVRSISAISGSATPPTGTFNLLLLRRLTEIQIPIANLVYPYDWAQIGFPRVYDDSCLMLAVFTNSTTTPNPLSVNVTLKQG